MWQDYYDFILEHGQQAPPLATGQPFYVLLESLGGDAQRDSALLEAVLQQALEDGLVSDAIVAKSESERLALWAIRDDVASLMTVSPMFMFDVSLPIKYMPAYLDDLRQALAAGWRDARLYVFGHLGDGNLHLAIQAGPADGSHQADVEKLVYTPLQDYAGSISAEHGIGLEKLPWLNISRTDAEIALMRQLKQALDPRGILNPGKIFLADEGAGNV
jgi:FAD/FMN-containing dehydrogenase